MFEDNCLDVPSADIKCISNVVHIMKKEMLHMVLLCLNLRAEFEENKFEEKKWSQFYF